MQQHGDTSDQSRRQHERDISQGSKQPRQTERDWETISQQGERIRYPDPDSDRDRNRDRDQNGDIKRQERHLSYGIEQQHRPIDRTTSHPVVQQSHYGMSSNMVPKSIARSMTSTPPVPLISPLGQIPDGPMQFRPAEPYRPSEPSSQGGPFRPAYNTSVPYSEYPPRPVYYSQPTPAIATSAPVHVLSPPVPAPPLPYYRTESREYQGYHDVHSQPQALPPLHWQYQHQQTMPPPYPMYPDRRIYEQIYSTYSNIATTLPGAVQQINLPHIDAMIFQAATVAQSFDPRYPRSDPPRRKRKASASSSSSNALYCHSCMTTETPEWRKGPMGPRTLCNACGLIWAKLEKAKKKKEQEEAQEAQEAKEANEAKEAQARQSSRPTGEVGTMSAPSSRQGPPPAPSLNLPLAPITTPSIPPTPGSAASASTTGSSSTSLTSPELLKPSNSEGSTKGKQPEDVKR